MMSENTGSNFRPQSPNCKILQKLKKKEQEILSPRQQLTRVIAEYEAISVSHSYPNADLAQIRAKNWEKLEKSATLITEFDPALIINSFYCHVYCFNGTSNSYRNCYCYGITGFHVGVCVEPNVEVRRALRRKMAKGREVTFVTQY